jgi:hypothetical protein
VLGEVVAVAPLDRRRLARVELGIAIDLDRVIGIEAGSGTAHGGRDSEDDQGRRELRT